MQHQGTTTTETDSSALSKERNRKFTERIMEMPYQTLLDEFVDFTRLIIGENLTGIYLHGSLAMRCFHPHKSDIDLIVVVEADILDVQKIQFMEEVVRLNEQAPSKGLELSIVKREYCNPFVYPTPFELHFSPAHLQWFQESPEDYILKMKGSDIDLAAHFSIINHYGIVLYGEEIKDVFGEVPREDYIDSICADVENAKEDIAGNPVYVILNLCRVLAYLAEGLCLSKETGGKWAMQNLHMNTEDNLLIANTLECYAMGGDMTVEGKTAETFAGEMLQKISDCRKG